MIIFLCIYFFVAFLLMYLGHRLDKRDDIKADFKMFRSASTAVGAPPTAEDSGRPSGPRRSRTQVVRDSAKKQLRKILTEGDEAAEKAWTARFRKALWHQHAFCAVWLYRGRYGTPRAARVLALAIEISMLMCAVALENALEYPDPDCSARKSRDRCRKFTSFSGRKLCQWDQDSGDCEYRGPPADNYFTIEHFAAVVIAIAILLPVIILFEWAFLGVVVPSTPQCKKAGGGPPSAEDDVVIEKIRGIELIAAIPPSQRSDGSSRKFQKKLNGAARSDARLLTEARKRAPKVARAVLARCDELRTAMAKAQAMGSTRGKRMGYILYKLEEEMVRKWGVVSNQDVFEQHVSVLVWQQMRLARKWREDLDAITVTDSELRALWIAFKARSQALSKIDRQIYERVYLATASADDTPWELRSDPHPCTLAVAAVISLLCAGAPVAYLLSYSSNVGPQETVSFFVDVAFEFIIIFCLVFPLQIWVQYVVFPALIIEKIDRLTAQPEDAPRTYPYQTPMNTDALDYLLEAVPAMQKCLSDLATPVRLPLGLSERRQYHDDDGEEDDDDEPVIEQRLPERDVTLEELEEIYGHMTWRPLWTTSLVFFVAQIYMILPAALQEAALEETMLIFALVAFGTTKAISNGQYAGLIMLIAAIVIGWGALVVLGFLGSAIHSSASRNRTLKQARHQRSLHLLAAPPSVNRTSSATSVGGIVYPDEDELESPVSRPESIRSPKDLHLHEMVGTHATIMGLRNRPDLNGEDGFIESFLEDGRFRVIVHGQPFALRPVNLVSEAEDSTWHLASRG